MTTRVLQLCKVTKVPLRTWKGIWSWLLFTRNFNSTYMFGSGPSPNTKPTGQRAASDSDSYLCSRAQPKRLLWPRFLQFRNILNMKLFLSLVDAEKVTPAFISSRLNSCKCRPRVSGSFSMQQQRSFALRIGANSFCTSPAKEYFLAGWMSLTMPADVTRTGNFSKCFLKQFAWGCSSVTLIVQLLFFVHVSIRYLYDLHHQPVRDCRCKLAWMTKSGTFTCWCQAVIHLFIYTYIYSYIHSYISCSCRDILFSFSSRDIQKGPPGDLYEVQCCLFLCFSSWVLHRWGGWLIFCKGALASVFQIECIKSPSDHQQDTLTRLLLNSKSANSVLNQLVLLTVAYWAR